MDGGKMMGMTLEDARKVAAIASTADGGCSSCVLGLCEQLQEAFPAFRWEYSRSSEESDYDPHIEVTDLSKSS